MTFCSGGSVVLTSSSATGNTWSTGETTESITVSSGGTYTVMVDDGVCVSGASSGTTVTVNALPSIPTITADGPLTLSLGESVVLSTIPGVGLSYQWQINGLDIAGATTSTYTVTEAGIYSVVVTNGSSCDATSLGIEVTVSELFNIPSIITPNGDGVNDVLVIEHIELYPNNGLTIYNRWGQEVFKSDQYQNNWGGENMYTNSENNILPEGTYFYTFDTGVAGNKLIKGFIYLTK